MDPLQNLMKTLNENPNFLPPSSDDVDPEKYYKTLEINKYEPIQRRYKPKKDIFEKKYEFCDLCGVDIVKGGMYKHKKTQIHQNYELLNERLKEMTINIRKSNFEPQKSIFETQKLEDGLQSE